MTEPTQPRREEEPDGQPLTAAHHAHLGELVRALFALVGMEWCDMDGNIWTIGSAEVSSGGEFGYYVTFNSEDEMRRWKFHDYRLESIIGRAIAEVTAWQNRNL